jgi:ABC-type nitrate/sulfonate/bicarbonate transport system substrate-binding protein
MDRSPLVLVGLRERTGEGLAALRRPRVGIWEGEDVEIRAMLARAGVAADRTTFVPMGEDVSPLLKGEVDFLQATVYEELPRLIREGAAPDALVVHRPRDYGLEVAKDGLVTSRRLLEETPDLAAAVTHAVVRGWLDASRDASVAVDAVLALRPDLDAELQRAQLATVLDLISPNRPLGRPEFAAVQQSLAAFDAAGWDLASRAVAIDDGPWTAAADALSLTAAAAR